MWLSFIHVCQPSLFPNEVLFATANSLPAIAAGHIGRAELVTMLDIETIATRRWAHKP